jgi:hypothetical protein
MTTRHTITISGHRMPPPELCIPYGMGLFLTSRGYHDDLYRDRSSNLHAESAQGTTAPT